MKKILFLVVIAIVTLGCKTKQVMSTSGEVEVVKLCADYKSDKTAMRATANAISPNMQNATDKAVAIARRELATSMSATIQRVWERFETSYEKDTDADFLSRTKDMTRQASNELVTGSVIVCDKVTKSTDANGKTIYHAYVAVEIGNDELLKRLETAVSKDDKLRVDFEFENFKKTFYEEMEKLAN
jgi:hypothetical protein